MNTESRPSQRLPRRIPSLTNLTLSDHPQVSKHVERYYDKSSAMKLLIDSVISHIKAFDGDIFGGVVRDYRTTGVPYVKDINCRIDGMMLHIFINTLQLHYVIKDLPTVFSGYFVDFSKKLHISAKPDSGSEVIATPPYVILDIITLTRGEWMRLPCDFDVNLMAENSLSCYVRSTYLALNKFVDQYGFIQRRLRGGKFALLESCGEKSSDEVKHLIDRGARLVSCDWTMDDMILGKSSWLVNYWCTISSLTKECRTCFDNKDIEMLKVQTECSLCNEAFKSRDIIINTKCNHNFHWCQERNDSVATETSHTNCKGLREWIRLGKTTCPICRKNIF